MWLYSLSDSTGPFYDPVDEAEVRQQGQHSIMAFLEFRALQIRMICLQSKEKLVKRCFLLLQHE
jgi:hypothetical protein